MQGGDECRNILIFKTTRLSPLLIVEVIIAVVVIAVVVVVVVVAMVIPTLGPRVMMGPIPLGLIVVPR